MSIDRTAALKLLKSVRSCLDDNVSLYLAAETDEDMAALLALHRDLWSAECKLRWLVPHGGSEALAPVPQHSWDAFHNSEGI